LILRAAAFESGRSARESQAIRTALKNNP